MAGPPGMILKGGYQDWSIEIEEHKVVDPKIVCFQWGFSCLGFQPIFEADLKGKTEYAGWK